MWLFGYWATATQTWDLIEKRVKMSLVIRTGNFKPKVKLH